MSKQSGRKHDQGGNFCRSVDIVTTAGNVRCGNHRNPQPSTLATDGAEHREGPNAREAGARALGVP